MNIETCFKVERSPLTRAEAEMLSREIDAIYNKQPILDSAEYHRALMLSKFVDEFYTSEQFSSDCDKQEPLLTNVKKKKRP